MYLRLFGSGLSGRAAFWPEADAQFGNMVDIGNFYKLVIAS